MNLPFAGNYNDNNKNDNNKDNGQMRTTTNTRTPKVGIISTYPARLVSAIHIV
jgi:hypothetical protein